MKVIVTGANGFIGNKLCQSLLKHNIELFCIVRNRKRMKLNENNNLKIIECRLGNYEDLLKYQELYNADVFYHLAWEGSFGDVLADYSIQNKNLNYSCEALNIAIKMNIKKFIFAGTINELELLEYFNADINKPRKKSIYGIAKLATELELKTIAANNNIIYNTAIIGSCFGPGDMTLRIHNAFMLSLLKNEVPKLVACENLHDWVYIDEIAEMLLAVGIKSINMKNYYLGHNRLRKLKDILLDVKNIINPNAHIEFGNVPGDLFVDYSLVDINSIYADCGYVNNFNFAKEIEETVDWLKKERIN